jgi:hypothetical protein
VTNQVIVLSSPALLGRAGQLATALKPLDVTVTQTTPGGADLIALQRARKRSTCIILCRSSDLTLEATSWDGIINKALQQGRCIPVLFEAGGSPAPLPPVDLSLWRGGSASAGLPVLRDRVQNFFSKPRWTMWKIAGGLSALPVLYFAGLMLGIFSDGENALNKACAWSVLRPACAYVSIGNVPSASEEKSFQRAAARGCDGLRDLVRTEPDNPRVTDAQRLVSAARHVRTTRWIPAERRLSLFVSGEPKNSRSAAEEATRGASRSIALELCSMSFGTSASYQLKRSSLDVRLTCDVVGVGWRCSARGAAVCSINDAHTVNVELCR